MLICYEFESAYKFKPEQTIRLKWKNEINADKLSTRFDLAVSCPNSYLNYSIIYSPDQNQTIENILNFKIVLK